MSQILKSICLLFAWAALSSASPEKEIAEKVPKARDIIRNWQSQDPVALKKTIHIVYWSPSDREPAADYVIRLGDIFLDIQRYYSKEMERIGFGAVTFGLDKNEDGKVRIHLAKGGAPYAKYARGIGWQD